jgi:hypothetical protein
MSIQESDGMIRILIHKESSTSVIVEDTILKYARETLRVQITETHTSVDYIPVRT